MPTNYNSAGSNISPGRNRYTQRDIVQRLIAVEQQRQAEREEDFSRRRLLACLRFALGDTAPELTENFLVDEDAWYKAYYDTAVRYRSAEMTPKWVEKYLGRMSYGELNNWINTRQEIVDHLEYRAHLGDMRPYHPYRDSWQRVRITKFQFLFDPVLVNVKSEHPANWRLDMEAVLLALPLTFDRLSKDVQELLGPVLREQLPNPQYVAMKSRSVAVDPKLQKQIDKELQFRAEIIDKIVVDANRINDPKPSLSARISALFKNTFYFKRP